MARFYNHQILKRQLIIILSVLLFTPTTITGQSDRSNTRSFAEVKAHFEKQYEGTPVKGNHKRFRRNMHFQKTHLDAEGNMFNHTLANERALQHFYIDTFPAVIQGEWQGYGPKSVVASEFSEAGVGRVNCIAFASADVWYAGSAGGGLWRSDESGEWAGIGNDYSWYPLTDSLPSLAVSGIAVHPNNVDDVFILTGDGDGGNFAARGNHPGIGILHSTNGGVSWSTTSLQYGMTQMDAGFKLGMFPGDPSSMLAACTDGIYRTADSWNTMSRPVTAMCYDFEFKPNDPMIIYGGFAGALRRSTDGGLNFTNITSNLDQTNLNLGNMGRMELAVSPDDPNVLYVIIANINMNVGGLMTLQKSTDGGDSFVEMLNNSYNILANDNVFTTTVGQGNYDLAIWADPNNANVLLVGGVNIWKFNGSGWSEVMHWTNEPPNYTHADIHALETDPFSGDVIACSDGGIYASGNIGETWFTRSRGLGIMQYYHFNVHSPGSFGSPSVTAGSQDNGTTYGLGDVANVFEMIGGGDGFATYRGAVDGQVLRYRSVQNGKLYRQFLAEGPSGEFWIEDLITPDDQLNSDETGRGVWDTPYKRKFFNIEELLAGYDNLYFSADAGSDWVKLTVNNPNGTYDNSKMISQIEWARNTGNLAYFFISDNTSRDLWRCDALFDAVNSENLNDGDCMTRSLNSVAIMPTTLPTDIAMHPSDEDQVWLSFPGYTDGMKVYYNEDFPADSPWVNITYNLPNVPTHCIEYDVDGMYAGTDIGVFFLPNGEEEWIYFSKGLPTVAVTEIQIVLNSPGKTIWASTWGRGIWKSSPPTPVRRTLWYVDDDATGSNSGVSWASAFTNLQTALDTVSPADSIWVAGGTYFPETATGFHLNADHVLILGGFSANQDSISERNISQNKSILNGDLGVPGDSLDNAYHVFVFDGNNIDVLLDGFDITEGNARGTGSNANGGGIYYSAGTSTGKPTITRCNFYNNRAGATSTGLGGALYFAYYHKSGSDFWIEQCTFENNIAINRGGGIYFDTYTNAPVDIGTLVARLNNCSFKNNTSRLGGGAIYNEANNGGSIILHVDSTMFDNNKSTAFQSNGGDGVYNYVRQGYMLFNCTNSSFINHVYSGGSNGGGSGVLNDCGLNSAGRMISVFKNCNFDSNTGATGAAIYDLMDRGISSMVMEKCTLTNNVSTGPGSAIHFKARNNGNTTASIDECNFSGNDSGGNGVLTFNAEYAGVINATIDSSIFTNNEARYGGAIEGYSRVLQGVTGALNLTITNSDFTDNEASANGGAIRLLNSAGSINGDIQNTKFSNNYGRKGGAVYHLHTVNGSSNLTVNYSDCVFTKNLTLLTGSGGGGAIYNYQSSGTISECDFIENGSVRGGAINNYSVSNGYTFQHDINNCVFSKNYVLLSGGAIYSQYEQPSMMNLDILECYFDSNYTTHVSSGRGGAIYNYGNAKSHQSITSSIFTDNFASSSGGAIHAQRLNTTSPDSLFLVVENCVFTNNDVNAGGESIHMHGAHSTWLNSHFYNDEAGVMFQNKLNGGFSTAVFSNTFFHRTEEE